MLIDTLEKYKATKALADMFWEAIAKLSTSQPTLRLKRAELEGLYSVWKALRNELDAYEGEFGIGGH